jgi:hypothetical protein
MTANDKATLPVQADHLGKMASNQQDQITTITDFFQERYGSPSLRITRSFLLKLPAALNAPPDLAFLWEVRSI